MKKIVLFVLCFALLFSLVACGQDKPPVTDPDTDGASETMTDAATEGQTGENETESESSGMSYIYSLVSGTCGYKVDDNPEDKYPDLYFTPNADADAISIMYMRNEAGDERYLYHIKEWNAGFETNENLGRGHAGTYSAWFFKCVDPFIDDDGNRSYNFCVTKVDRQSRSIEQHNFSLPVQSSTPFGSLIDEQYEWYTVSMPNENTWFISIFHTYQMHYEKMVYLAKTTDGGKSWEVMDSGLPEAWGRHAIVGCYFFDENNGLFIVNARGETMVAPTIFTYDGGKSWEYIEMPWEEYNPDMQNSLEFRSCEYELPRSASQIAGRMNLSFYGDNGRWVTFYSYDLKNWKYDKWWVG